MDSPGHILYIEDDPKDMALTLTILREYYRSSDILT
jgi:hypothetical protein